MKCPTVIIKIATGNDREKYKENIKIVKGMAGQTMPVINKRYGLPLYMMAKLKGENPNIENITVGTEVYKFLPKKIVKSLNNKDKEKIKNFVIDHEIDELKRMQLDKDGIKRSRPLFGSLTGVVGANILAVLGVGAYAALKKGNIGRLINSISPEDAYYAAMVPSTLGLLGGMGIGAIHNLIDKPDDDPNLDVYSHKDPNVVLNESNRLIGEKNKAVREFGKYIRKDDGMLKHWKSLGLEYGEKKYDSENEVLRKMIHVRANSTFWKHKVKKMVDHSIGKYEGEIALRQN